MESPWARLESTICKPVTIVPQQLNFQRYRKVAYDYVSAVYHKSKKVHLFEAACRNLEVRSLPLVLDFVDGGYRSSEHLSRIASSYLY